MNLHQLLLAITECWGSDTSASPHWTPDNPPLGQCAVTALVIQDYMGGDLLRVTNGGEGHYFNRFPNPDGVGDCRLDHTWSQFTRIQWDPQDDEQVRDRAYVLSYPDTVARYELLRDRVAAIVGLP